VSAQSFKTRPSARGSSSSTPHKACVPEEAGFGCQVPYNDVRIVRARCEKAAGPIEAKSGDRTLVSIQRHHTRPAAHVPHPDNTVAVPALADHTPPHHATFTHHDM
jgi:hypothetical protein